MGNGYTRNDTINNIADGNIINAADFDGEYDAIESAFNSSTGHTHDGTSGEGGPVTVLGPAQDFVASTTEIKPKTNNTLDIGTSLLKFKNVHIAGTANLPTVDIDAGAIDGTVIGANSAAAGTFAALTGTTVTASTNLTLASGATVTAILDEDTLSSDSDTSLATQQSIKAYVDSQVAGSNELSEILSNGNITAGTGIDLIDNDKIRFGTGNDLEIFHDASDSIINDAGTGSLKIQQGGTTRIEVSTTGINVTDDVDINGDLDVGDDISLSSDGAIINFGADSEITLTHEHNTGLQAKSANGFELNLQTSHTSVESGDVLGKITFNAPDEAGGTDALLDGAAIEAVAEATFASDNNSTALVFKTNTSAAATERMRIKSDGTIVMDTQVDIDNITINGNAITSTDTNGNIDLTPNGTGEVNITKVDIDSGAIDGVTLGTNSAITELQVDNININGNAITSTDSNGNIALTPAGTGEVDISKVDIDSGAIDGTVIGANSAVAGTFAALTGTAVTASTNLTLASGATVTAILDEDDMTSSSDTSLATQQSIKAYVDSQVGGGSFSSGISVSGGNIQVGQNGTIIFEGATDDTSETTLTVADPQQDNTVTIPDVTGYFAMFAADPSTTTVAATPAELNIMDGGTAASSTTLVDADRLVVNDDGTMKQVALSDVKTYMSSAGFSSDDPTALAIALG